ncbi:MAG: aryl-sulfate sulfotransferase [Pseudohongiellaceae bacterium]|uniref:Thioredoxin n=1 Tax=OM182 bacterium MED-G28 TaxID=1986256 RepID=A0A2A5WBL1_9GAMM|nr:thioredoxin [Gammaproteobacteria bacterium]PDH33812.1 MAG: thioredoxin [OM182 bacterium MED-G28]
MDKKNRWLRLMLAGLITIVLENPSTNAVVSVFPTGTTIYKPDKTWNGYTIIDAADGQGTVLLDMNGNELRRWPELDGMGPFRILPGGYIMGGDVRRNPYQESVVLKQLDWDGNEVWRYDRAEETAVPSQSIESGEAKEDDKVWASRQHHDWQREGDHIGYYSPTTAPLTSSGKTMVLAHKNVYAPAVSNMRLEDDYIYEVDWEGNVLWEWLASDHIDEFGFSEDARNAIFRSTEFDEDRQSADWLHINSANYLGPNKWYKAGDERFHPDHIMISSRTANIIAIIARDGSITWRLGPDYSIDQKLNEIGQIIGQHNPHLIPEGLPGAGNLLVFDNGGTAGYGFSNPAAPDGVNSMTRDSSRVLEINPSTLEVVWEYTKTGTQRFQFYSWYVSNAQRLPNGNTMVNEGMNGRVFELTPEEEIVWEYVSPFFSDTDPPSHRIYRAYRLPYDWIPQLELPEERPVIPPALGEFRIPAQ